MAKQNMTDHDFAKSVRQLVDADDNEGALARVSSVLDEATKPFQYAGETDTSVRSPLEAPASETGERIPDPNDGETK